MSNVFYRFSPFIQDYIYRHGWKELRSIQADAAKVIFDTDSNLLISSATASGKTEAAFFPILSEFEQSPPTSFGALYIAPLKSLINDQFSRLEEILDLTGINAYHWHGDVAASHKSKALREPSGILQITPESLESMLINRSNDIPRIFGDLRYVILDEVHTLVGSDRGGQIMAQLSRIQRIIGRVPRRIALSATMGDPEEIALWLGAGTGKKTEVISAGKEKITWRLALEHFSYHPSTVEPDAIAEQKEKPPVADAGFEYLYNCSKGKKCIAFSNSREETERLTATLRQIAEDRCEPDRFLIHHGNLSAALREEAELRLKNDDKKTVTCATVTLELGVDIGQLERILHLESPHSVSSFLQRLGRSGRRGDPPEMVMVFREEETLPNTPLPQLMPWELLRAIAIIQLYLEERFIEPPQTKKLPFSLMFQQTLSVLAASGSLPPARVAERVMSLPPFEAVEPEDYKLLLRSMLENDYLEITEDRELIIGLKGERLINNFKFYAVFKDSEDYTVRCESDEIGTISSPPPIGERFALAGRVWETEEVDVRRRLIYVKKVKGKMEISWPGDIGEIHTKILQRMHRVLTEDTIYPYLKPNAQARLAAARRVAHATGMDKDLLVHLGGYTWCLFPWLGTRSFRALRRYIAANAKELGISGIEHSGCYYMTFKMERGSREELVAKLAEYRERITSCKDTLVSQTELPTFEKYDACIPGDLLRKAYVEDRLCFDEIGELVCDKLI